MLELAEAPSRFAPVGEGEKLIVTDRYVLALGRGPHWNVNVAQRLRFAPDSVAAAVEEVRAVVRARGGAGLTWEVANAATPRDLAERLRGLGARPADTPYDPVAVVMTLREPPAPPPAGIAVTRVATVEDFRRYVSVTHEVFGLEQLLDEELARIDREGARDLADMRFVRYLGWIEGEVVAAAAATFTDAGAILHAGSTRPKARGRGAYRALVAARWDDAVRRGTPALVTRAGPMSRPILERLGFEPTVELQILVDEL